MPAAAPNPAIAEPPFVSRYLVCAQRELHLCDWPAAPGVAARGTVVAWHGLARTGRDMDELAAHLSAQGWRVICPDTLGRGLSQWAAVAKDEYCFAFYARLARELVEQLQIDRLCWVGTSMGGALGLVGAAGFFEPALARRVRALVLNDMGAQTSSAAIERIKAYAGQPPAFARVSELEAFLRNAYQPYGWLSEAQWRRMAETSTRRLPDGRVTLHYDPAIVGQFSHHPDDYALWPHWDALRLPVLLLRGADSDLLLPDTVAAMRQRGPGAHGLFEPHEIAGCGHAPALNVPAQWALVSDFLARAPA